MDAGAFVIFLIFSLISARILTPYDSRYDNGKYILVKNKKIAKILIEKQLFSDRRNVQKKDRNKMSIMGFILYIANALLVFVSIILVCSPKIPCTPFELSDEETVYLYADTLNEKVIAIFSIVVLCMSFIAIAVSMFKGNKQLVESKIEKFLVYAVAVFMILLGVAIIAVVLGELF